MKVSGVILMGVFALAASVSKADTLVCSNSDASVKYKFTLVKYGNPPAGRPLPSPTSNWILTAADGVQQTLPGTAYAFDEASKKSIERSGNLFKGHSIYVVKAVEQTKHEKNPSAETLICTFDWFNPI
jgi:hypothetical protein